MQFIKTTILMLLCTMPSLAGEKKILDLGSKVRLILETSVFEPKKHTVSNCEVTGFKGVCLIDGKPVFGTNWDLPRTSLDDAKLELEGSIISLDVSCMYNPDVDAKSFSLLKAPGGWHLKGYFSDGAGGYNAQWLIIVGSSIRTLLARREE